MLLTIFFKKYSKYISESNTYSTDYEQGTDNPTNIYLFKVNNINTIKRCEIYYKLTIKTPQRRQC